MPLADLVVVRPTSSSSTKTCSPSNKERDDTQQGADTTGPTSTTKEEAASDGEQKTEEGVFASSPLRKEIRAALEQSPPHSNKGDGEEVAEEGGPSEGPASGLMSLARAASAE